jgi:hypothetical protein
MLAVNSGGFENEAFLDVETSGPFTNKISPTRKAVSRDDALTSWITTRVISTRGP